MEKILFVLSLFMTSHLFSQDSVKKEASPVTKYSVGFKKAVDTITRSNKPSEARLVEILASNNTDKKLEDYSIKVEVDNSKTTLPQKDYKIITDLSGTKLPKLKGTDNNYVVSINNDDPKDVQVKPLKLILKIIVNKILDDKTSPDEEGNNTGELKTMELVIMPAEAPLSSYRFLGYLGTNFDLVDGVQANKLFFATNIFIADTKKWGMSLGIYGNRTMTKTDSVRNVGFTSRIVSINRDSIAYYRDTAMKVKSQVSDNIGAYFSPLILIKGLSDNDDLKLYYAPQFEFIWRRTKLKDEYLNNATIRIDSARNRYPATTAFPLVTPLNTNVEINSYDLYLGLAGFLLRYETDEISVRLSSSVGINFNYFPIGGLSGTADVQAVNTLYQKTSRFFYFGRLYITEPSTGLTLGAEIYNYSGKDKSGNSRAQPYYNVTLSKAFNLKNLAAIVKPLTTR